MSGMNHYKLLVLLLFCGFSTHGQDVYRISDGKKHQIGEYISFFLDSTNSLSASAVLDRTFEPSEVEVINFSLTSSTAWLRFTLKNELDRDIILELGEPNLEELEFYEITAGSPKELFKGSFKNRFEQKAIKHNRWLFNLEIPPGEERTYLLKASSGFPLKLPLNVYSDIQYISRNAVNNLWWGIYGGIMAFAFFYNFFLFASLKERIYLYYCFYVLTGSAFYLGLQGYPYQYLWPNIPYLNIVMPVLLCLMNLFVFLFTLRFLKITPEQRFAYYVGWFFVGLYMLAALTNLLVDYGLAIMMTQLLSVFMSIYYIIVAVNAIRRRVPNARYFALAWIQFIVLMVIFILADNRVLPSNKFTMHSLFIGNALEVILLSYALAARIDFLRTDNEEKQSEIIRQLEEKEQIQLKANEELEQKVVARTQEVVNQRNAALRERNRSNELLLNILPEETAEELKNTGRAEAKEFENVTVLFTDIASFTNKSEKLSSEELVSTINEIFTEFDQIVDKYGIEKIKTIGDAYMAAAGLPSPDEDHALKALNAAIEMQAYMEARSQRMMDKEADPFQIRLGLHSGPVVAGVVGSKKFAYDIWGSTVNVASRMEHASEVNRINISQATYDLIKDYFTCTYRGKVEIKGVGFVPMYFAENTSPVNLAL